MTMWQAVSGRRRKRNEETEPPAGSGRALPTRYYFAYFIANNTWLISQNGDRNIFYFSRLKINFNIILSIQTVIKHLNGN